ncbi:TPA: hypothetical protein UM046_004311 [Stenotrophomonas maltophilia]|nr:hypothetical protein [Stenotrophomonas maltophilia]HEL3786495.1 hypothetical protein [Stenotrophomonas maltophilia]
MSSAPDCRLDWAALSTVGGWLAALATFLAVLVALAPIVMSFMSRRSEARLLGMVAIDDLLVQELHLLAAMKIPARPDKTVTCWEYEKVSTCIKMINSVAVGKLIGFSDQLPEAVRVQLADTIATLSAAELRRAFFVSPQPGDTVNLTGDIGWYEDVLEKIRGLRKELCEWLGMDTEDNSASGQRMAEILRAAASQNQRTWTASQLASRATGKAD